MIPKNTPRILPHLPYKNSAIALLYAVILGPIGLLYSTVWGGFIMILVAIIVLSNRYIIPVVLAWIICCIWSIMAANRYNNKIMEAWLEVWQ